MCPKPSLPQLDVLDKYKREYLEILKEIGDEFYLPKGSQMRDRDVYYLLQGVCSLCIEGENGKDVAVVYFYPGRVINFLPALDDFYPKNSDYILDPIANQDFFVKAISNCQLLHVDHKKFLERYFSSLPLHALVVQGLIDNCYALFAHLFNSMQNPAWQRVAALCMRLMSSEPPYLFRRRITYGEISTFLCIHPVTVAKIFKALLDSGILEKTNKIIRVCDPQRLRRVAQGREQLFYKHRHAMDNVQDCEP